MMVLAVFTMKNKSRFLVCFILLVLSLLLIGAGRVTREMNAHRKSQDQEKRNWREINANLVHYMPLEHKQEWLDVVSENPQFFLKINTAEFTKLEQVPNH